MNYSVDVMIINRAIVAAGLPILLSGISNTSDIQANWIPIYYGTLTPAQQTQLLTIVTTTPVTVAAEDAELRLQAQSQVDNWPIMMEAFALALIDQLNIIRAALPVPLSAITPAQAIAAIRAKAGTL
jgi:hypothetical protein